MSQHTCGNERNPQEHKPSVLKPQELVLIIGAVLAGLLAAYLTGLPLVIGFAAGFAVLWYQARKLGIGPSVLVRSAWSGMIHTKEVMWILLLVGMVIPAWMASGTIPYLIDAGLRLMSPAYFVTGCFLFCTVISMLLGTSTGTLSAAGIPLMGMAAILQVPLPLAAGAIVSGAFVGDRTSPFSSAHQLVASSTGIPVRRLGTAMAPTTAAAVMLAAGFFLLEDRLGQWAPLLGEDWSAGYSAAFRFNASLALPPVLLIGAIVLRLRTRYAFLISIAAAIAVGVAVQGVPPLSWPVYMWSGFSSAAVPSIHSKGVSGMLDLMLLIGLAGAFNGILEERGLIKPYVERILGRSPSLFGATLRTGLFGLALGLVSCTQTLPIMMSGRNLLDSWSRSLPKTELARTVGDTSLVFAAMVPWNLLAILCGTVLGLPVEQYIPYAVFLWSLPLLTLSLSGIRSARQKNMRLHVDTGGKN